MALSINGEIFYNQIFPKLIFDKELGKYKLNLTAYIPANLNKRQTRILERICIKNDIIMEKLPEKISVQETEELFIKMKSLKEEMEQITDFKAKKIKEKEYYETRTKIFEGHQKIIYKLIMDFYPDLETSPFKEDIIQSCYEYLVKAIDKYDSEKGIQNFRWYIHFYVSKHMIRTITYIKNNGYNKELLEIINIREEEQEKGDNLTTSDLSLLSGMTVSRVEEILTLEQMLKSISIEELKENEDLDILSPFDLEETVNKTILEDLLILLVDTLPNEMQREVMKLYCGLGQTDNYRINEIAKLSDVSRQRIDQHRNDGVELLMHPSRLKYIKELYIGYTNKQFPKITEEQLEIDETDLVYEKLEKYLFKEIFEKEQLISIINDINPKYHNVLLTHFELTDDIFTNFKDKLVKTNLSAATYARRKREGLYLLRKQFREKYIYNQSNEDIKTILDYLMYTYLNNNRNKVKTRKKDGKH